MLSNEGPNFFQFIAGTAFESAGVVEDELGVALEDHLVVYVVLPALNRNKTNGVTDMGSQTFCDSSTVERGICIQV